MKLITTTSSPRNKLEELNLTDPSNGGCKETTAPLIPKEPYELKFCVTCV